MSAFNDNSIPSVCMVAPGEIFGGAERQILSLVANIAGRCRLTMALFHDGELAGRLRSLGHAPTVLPSGWGGVRQLRALVRDRDIQILHAHGYRATIEATVAVQGLPARVVKTVHGAPELDQPTLTGRIRARAFNTIERLMERCGKTYSIYVTRELRDRCATTSGIARSQVIYNGIDVKAIQNTQRPVEYPDGCQILLVLARLDYVKGVDVAIRSFAQVEASEAQLVVVGDGPERENLKALVRTLDLSQRVHFTGFRADVEPYLTHADMLLVPSRHEGLPYALLEAMAHRVPVVASQTGGIEEVLTDEVHALLAPPGQTTELARCIDRLVQNVPLRLRIANGAAELVNQKFTAKRMADRYLEVYEGLLPL